MTLETILLDAIGAMIMAAGLMAIGLTQALKKRRQRRRGERLLMEIARLHPTKEEAA